MTQMRVTGLCVLPRPFGNFPVRLQGSWGQKPGAARGRARCGSHAGWRRRPAPASSQPVEQPLQGLESGPVGLARDRHQQRRQGPQARSRAAPPPAPRDPAADTVVLRARQPAPAPPRSPAPGFAGAGQMARRLGDARGGQAGLLPGPAAGRGCGCGQSAPRRSSGSSSQSCLRRFEIIAQPRARRGPAAAAPASARRSPATERAPARAWRQARPARCRAPAAAERFRPGRPGDGRR